MMNNTIVEAFIDKLVNSKTEEDLEQAADLADEAVLVGALTEKQVEDIWADLEPDIYNY